MNASFSPYLDGRERIRPDGDAVAYVPVRVTKEVRPDGSVTVYLPDATAPDLRASYLLRVGAKKRQVLHRRRARVPLDASSDTGDPDGHR